MYLKPAGSDAGDATIVVYSSAPASSRARRTPVQCGKLGEIEVVEGLAWLSDPVVAGAARQGRKVLLAERCGEHWQALASSQTTKSQRVMI